MESRQEVQGGMSTTGSQHLLRLKKKIVLSPGPSQAGLAALCQPQQGLQGRWALKPNKQNKNIQEPGHCQPEWGLGQHGHDSKCRRTSQVPELTLYPLHLWSLPQNVIFPHCKQQTPLFFPWQHPTFPFSFDFFPSHPSKKQCLFGLSRAWMGLWALCLNPQTITNMAGCLALLISYQQCFIFPSVVSFWITRALLISSLPLWDATVEHYGIQIYQGAESTSLICLDNKKK